jgi:cytochrome P450
MAEELAQLREVLDGEAFRADPHAVLRHLRGEGALHRMEPLGAPAQWLVTTYPEARAVLTDRRVSKRSDAAGLEAGWLMNGTRSDAVPPYMLTVDPPEHTRLRNLVLRSFTPARIAALRPRLEAIAQELLAAVLASSAADLVADFCLIFPVTVISELLGVPRQDSDEFHAWSNTIVSPTAGVDMEQAFADMTTYLTGLIEAKRKDHGDDLLTALIVDVDDDELSDGELVGMALVLLVAGHSTTAALLADMSLGLFRMPDLLTRLRADRDLIPVVIEEFIRHDGPVQVATERFATEDMVIGDQRIHRGDMLIVALSSANRDASRFASPDIFDPTREPTGHLGFGHGIHHCLGAALARLEATVAVSALIEVLPLVELTVSYDEIPWLPGLLVHGPAYLPVRTRH